MSKSISGVRQFFAFAEQVHSYNEELWLLPKVVNEMLAGQITVKTAAYLANLTCAEKIVEPSRIITIINSDNKPVKQRIPPKWVWAFRPIVHEANESI